MLFSLAFSFCLCAFARSRSAATTTTTTGGGRFCSLSPETPQALTHYAASIATRCLAKNACRQATCHGYQEHGLSVAALASFSSFPTTAATVFAAAAAAVAAKNPINSVLILASTPLVVWRLSLLLTRIRRR